MLNTCSEIIWDLQSEAEDTSVRCVNLLELLRVSAAQFFIWKMGRIKKSTLSSYFQDCCDDNISGNVGLIVICNICTNILRLSLLHVCVHVIRCHT